MKKDDNYRRWEYAKLGDYHKNLDPDWSYTPTYLRKLRCVRDFIHQLPRDFCILDAGCGEGVLVEEFQAENWNIVGLDLNYESKYVRHGSLLDMPYSDETFDVVLVLDVLEHLAFEEQPKALKEIHRVLRKRGWLIASIPNLAHMNSRFLMACLGRLDRTDTEANHIGERPIGENRGLLLQSGFRILQTKGITLTVPIIYRQIICRRPSLFRWLHDLLEPIAVPSLAMLNIFICRKRLGI